MKYDFVIDSLVIPENELEITTSRAGGPGGQHVNKTDSRITVRWNVPNSQALDPIQKERVLANLQARLTTEGDLIIHNSESRSQQTNKENALNQLAGIVRKALHVPKKRRPTRMSKSAKAKRVDAKTHRGDIKKMRSGKIDY